MQGIRRRRERAVAIDAAAGDCHGADGVGIGSEVQDASADRHRFRVTQGVSGIAERESPGVDRGAAGVALCGVNDQVASPDLGDAGTRDERGGYRGVAGCDSDRVVRPARRKGDVSAAQRVAVRGDNDACGCGHVADGHGRGRSRKVRGLRRVPGTAAILPGAAATSSVCRRVPGARAPIKIRAGGGVGEDQVEVLIGIAKCQRERAAIERITESARPRCRCRVESKFVSREAGDANARCSKCPSVILRVVKVGCIATYVWIDAGKRPEINIEFVDRRRGDCEVARHVQKIPAGATGRGCVQELPVVVATAGEGGVSGIKSTGAVPGRKRRAGRHCHGTGDCAIAFEGLAICERITAGDRAHVIRRSAADGDCCRVINRSRTAQRKRAAGYGGRAVVGIGGVEGGSVAPCL